MGSSGVCLLDAVSLVCSSGFESDGNGVCVQVGSHKQEYSITQVCATDYTLDSKGTCAYK